MWGEKERSATAKWSTPHTDKERNEDPADALPKTREGSDQISHHQKQKASERLLDLSSEQYPC